MDVITIKPHVKKSKTSRKPDFPEEKPSTRAIHPALSVFLMTDYFFTLFRLCVIIKE